MASPGHGSSQLADSDNHSPCIPNSTLVDLRVWHVICPFILYHICIELLVMFTHGYIRWTSGFWWGGGGVLLCMGTWVHNYYTIHNVIHRRAADTGRAANFRRNHRRFKSTNFNVLYFPLLLPRMLLSKESRMQMAIAAWKEKKNQVNLRSC